MVYRNSKMLPSASVLDYFFIFVLVIISPQVRSFLMDKDNSKLRTDSSIPPLAEPPLKIGSFNIQVFGRTKNNIPEVVNVLIKVLSRYDIVQVLEIRDVGQTEFESLRNSLNAYVRSQGGTYSYDKVQSGRLGRTASKEQYGFLYRTDKVTMVDTYQYPDKNDLFEREPFGVRFNSSLTVVKDFGLIAIHVQPSSALQEIENLTNVYEAFQNHWNLANIMVAGDFNADCNYISVGALQDVSFRRDGRFYWTIPDNMDTSVTSKHCSYDKFVVAGSALINAVVPGSAQAYRFDEEMRLSYAQALHVSDHYPVELELAGEPFSATQLGIETSIGFTVKDTQDVSNVNNIRALYRSPSCADSTFTIKVEKESTHMDFVTASLLTPDATSLMAEVDKFSRDCPGTLSEKLLATVNAYLKSDYLTGQLPNVYGLIFSARKNKYETVITCSLIPPYICKIDVSLQVSG